MIVLAIGDTHSPFAHPDALDFLAHLKRHFKPDQIVHIGDLGDQYGWSRHGRDPDGPGQEEEYERMLAWNRQLYKLFPKAKACVGNHCKRAAKAAGRAGLPSKLIKTIHQIYDCPDGWEWRDDWLFDDVIYTHGLGFGGLDCAIKAARAYCGSCVIGHTHSVGGVRWVASSHKRVFGCSTGCLVDVDSIAMGYGKEYSAKPVLGSAVICDGVPHFLPMPT